MAVAPTLYVIVDRDTCGDDDAWFDALAEVSAALSGAAMLQARDKHSDAERAVRARAARRVCRGAAVPVLYNGSSEEAEAAGFDGAHWAEAAIPRGRREGLFAASIHTEAKAASAHAAGASFVVFAPVFDAGSKSVRGVGVARLRDVCRQAPLPVLALGGLAPSRVEACLGAGAHGVAAISAIVGSPDRAAAVAAFQRALRTASPATSS